MQKFILTLIVLFLGAMCSYADTFGSGLPRYSSNSLGSGLPVYSNSQNTYHSNNYGYSTPVASPVLNRPTPIIPYSGASYRRYGDTVYSSNGGSCRTYGDTTYCN